MPDLRQLLRNDYEGFQADIKGYAQKLREGRKKLGPRQKAKLRDHLMSGVDASESLPIVEQMYAAANHQDGEARPCAACKFLGKAQ